MSSTDQKGFPLVSFCLCVFNQEDFIRKAVEGALNQDYPNLEIIISDDCSTDRTWEIITEIIASHTEKNIILNRNRKNLGLSAHMNKIYYELTSGEYVSIAAGDDISLPNRVSKTMDFLMKNNEVCAVSNNLRLIDSNSVEIKGKEYNNVSQNEIVGFDYYTSNNYKHINGTSRTVSRSLINAFPPLNSDCPTEDTPFLLRAFMYGKVAQLSEYLVKYRMHNQNLSSAQSIAKMNHEAIFDQYYSDISWGLDKYINEKQFHKIIPIIRHKEIKKLNIPNPKKNRFLLHSLNYRIMKRIMNSKNLNLWDNGKRSLIAIIRQYIYFKINNKKTIQLGGSTWSSNYGDRLNISLLEELIGKKYYESALYSNSHKNELLMIGSILHKMNLDSVIWGAGLIKEGVELKIKPKKIHAVRGPLTRKELIRNNIQCPEIYGDPALLLPMFYKPEQNKKFKYGLIPHYVDKHHPFIRKFKKSDDVLFIDIESDYNNWKDFIDLISQCECIITSSLHGVIISDTYEIPNLWVKLTDGVTGNGFKFKDYYASVKKNYSEPFDLNQTKNQQIIELERELEKWTKIDFDKQVLLDAFPYSGQLNRKIAQNNF